MGLSHASVSLQIKSLEESLGVTLFERNGRYITLTREGHKLLSLALPHIDGIQNIHDVFHTEFHVARRTELRIAANSTGINFILPTIIKEYLAAFPEIYITIHFAEHDEAMRMVNKKEVDFAVLPHREHMPFPETVDYLPTFYYKPALITRADHPLAGRRNLTVREISQYELTLPEENLRVIPNLYDIFPKHGINKKLHVNFVKWETTRKDIELGRSISISSDVILSENDQLVGTPLSHLFDMVDYGFVLRHGTPIPDKVVDFINIARQQRTAKSMPKRTKSTRFKKKQHPG
jgi:DNA-binding transcriptional LysR family regulator